ncbi:MAG: hypothetical protein R3C53_12160 [Pirellulaceae bacterium]
MKKSLAILWFTGGFAAWAIGQQPPPRITSPASPLATGPIPAPVPPPIRPTENGDAAPVVTASATEPTARSIQSILLRAKNELNPNTLPKVDVSKSELQFAIYELENFVGLGTSNGQAWNTFLRLDELREELEEERPDVNLLMDLEMNMRQNYLGLEYQQFIKLRDKLNQYIRALRYGSDPEKFFTFLEKKIDAVVVDLNEPEEGSGLARSNNIGVVTNYLHESGQTPWAISQVRSHYNTPNIQVYARETLLNRLLMRQVAEPNPVDECILGTRILGRACMAGVVSADVVPMLNGVSMRLNLSGTMTSQNKGYNRGVVFNTTGTSPVFATKQIFITPSGISSAPASASTNLQSEIQSIEHRLRIVRRIAKKKAAQQKPQADLIAQGRLQSKVQTQYDQQVNEQLAQASGQLSTLQAAGQRPEIRRIGLPRPTLAIHSTDSTVNGQVVQAAAHQLTTTSQCTISQPASSEIVVEAHQSAAINALDILMGGRTIRSENIDEYVQQITGQVSEEVKREAAGEPWTLTFASFRPIEVELDNDQVKLILRVTKMTRRAQVLNDSLTITVTYQPSYRDGVLTMTRVGDIDISGRGTRATALRAFLKRKLEETFKEQVATKRLDLKQQFPNAPELVINSIKIDGGWVQVGMR